MLTFVNHDDRFTTPERTYTQQFAGLYFTRLALMRKRVLSRAIELWGPSSDVHPKPRQVDRLLDIEPNVFTFVVGTVYMDMPLKPNVLDEITRENWVVAPPPRTKYTSDKDEVVLEDEYGRVKLSGAKLEEHVLVTGIVIGACGYETQDGDFEVVDICFPSFAPQAPLPTNEGDGKWIAFVSGLLMGDDASLGIELELMIDFLSGEAGDGVEASQIVRVVFAGNCMSRGKLQPVEVNSKDKASALLQYSLSQVEVAGQLDDIFTQVCSAVDVDVMPGDQDITNYSIPQQPMQSAFFAKARGFSSFHLVTNPHAFELAGVSVLGTSGQNIDDIRRYVEDDDPLTLAEKTIRWGSIAPTAPDTLWSYPFKDRDPFIIDSVPHIYFVGNQPTFQTTLIEGPSSFCRVVMVPSFLESKTIALVNLGTLECKQYKFR
ncbi:DNA polymerase alpha/epsilon subunit B-domain-containing protein [Zopfochytrium polystomum]|nr:DNA polymerase alpha/epsilon subunit B-domain-containing protein [Zopfochytrium polystomum]